MNDAGKVQRSLDDIQEAISGKGGIRDRLIVIETELKGEYSKKAYVHKTFEDKQKTCPAVVDLEYRKGPSLVSWAIAIIALGSLLTSCTAIYISMGGK